MNSLERNWKLAAAVAALSVNLVLVASLAALARSYERGAPSLPADKVAHTRASTTQAASGPEAQRCPPAAARTG